MKTLLEQAADTLARQAAGSTWPGARIIFAAVVGLIALAAAAVFVSEFVAVRRAGGLKVYAKDVDLVSYTGLRSAWVYEIVLGGLAIVVLLHGIVPNLVSVLQIEAVYAVIVMAAAPRGINLGAFISKQTNADPAVMVTAAAIKDPTVQPLVTTNRLTGDTTVSVVPVASAASGNGSSASSETTTTTTKTTTTGSATGASLVEPNSPSRDATSETAAVAPPAQPPPPAAPPVFTRDA